MDFKSIYDDSYKKSFKITEKKIRDELILGAQVPISFNHVAGELITAFDKIYKNDLIFTTNSLTILNEKFKKLLEKYPENPNYHILEKDLKDLYLKINLDELPENYSYYLFIVDLAALNAKYEVFRLFRQQTSLYNMMYQLKDLSHFEIKQYNMVLEAVPIYRELSKRLYPDNSKEQLIKPKQNYLPTETHFNLNEKEKAFLFYVMCNALNGCKINLDNNLNLPFTELIRLNTIIDFKDDHCFKNSYRDSLYYKILSRGIQEIDKVERIDFLNRIISKTEKLKLSKTKKYILTIRNKELNKSIK